MKKEFLNYFFFLALLTLLSCKSKSSTGPVIEGEWGDCNGWNDASTITISKQGDIFLVHSKRNDFTIEKKTDELYTGSGGTVIFSYDIQRGHWILSGIGERKITLCRHTELN